MTRLPALPRPFSSQRRPSYRMTPEEEESNLAWLGRGAMSGLATFAHTFGKPGAAVRGTLSGLTGGPWGGGLLNLIPFSNTMGITDPYKWVWSRDMMRRAGVVGKKDTWGNFATGLAADIALDPLAWTTGGASAATRGGQLLQRAGLAKFLPDVAKKAAGAGGKVLGPRAQRMTTSLSEVLKNLPEEVAAKAPRLLERARLGAKGTEWMSKSELAMLRAGNEPIGGLIRIAPPFMRGGAFVGQNVPGALPLARGLDWLGHGIRYNAPVRHAFAGFSKPLEGVITAKGQKGFAAAARLKAFKSAMSREELAGDMFALNDMGLLRYDLQGIEDGGVMRQYLEKKLPKTGPSGAQQLPPHIEAARPILDRIRAKQPVILAAGQAEGMGTYKLMDETVDYFHRQVWRFDRDLSGGGRGRTYSATHPAQLARKDILEELGVGTASANRMSLDDRITGTAFTGKPEAILTPQVRRMVEEREAQRLAEMAGRTAEEGTRGFGAAAKRRVRDVFAKRTSAGVDIDAAVKILRTEYADDIAGWSTQKTEGLAKYLSNLDPQYPASGIPLFAHHPIVDQLARIEHHIRGVENARAARQLIGENARYVTEKMPGDVPVAEALQRAGLTGDQATTRMLRDLPEEIVDKFKNPPLGVAPPGVALDAEFISANVFVPETIAADLGRLNKTFTSPEWLQPIINAFDSYTNFFRGHVTTYWPAFGVRNSFSGQINNSIGGAYGPMAGDMARSLNDGQRLLTGGNISGVLEFPEIKALLSHSDPAVRAIARDPTMATRKIAELAFAHQLGGRMNMEIAQHLGVTARASLGDMTGQLPGLIRPSIMKSLKGAGPAQNPGWWNPLKVRGVGGAQESEFILSRLGEDANFYVEFMNRLPPFISYLRRGWDAGAAASRVKLMQVDYMAAASGDKVMRRLIPFWAFVSGQTKFIAREVMEKPGGALSQTIQAEARGHQELPPFSPAYVQNSAAIPGQNLPESIFGKAPGDSSRVITSLGMMHEDPLQFLGMDPRHPIRSLWKGPMHEAAGRLNPLLQMPLESLSGRSLWQAGPRGGRPLSTMDPSLGRLVSNITGAEEPPKLGALETVAKLVAGRWVSTAKGLTDTRKNIPVRLLNFLTGMKVTDVTPAARESQMREQVQALQQEMGGRVFEVINIPKEEKARMSPEELKKAELLELLWKVLGERGKRRAQRRDVEYRR